MNRVKFVPADPTARALGKPEVFVMKVVQSRAVCGVPMFKRFMQQRLPTVPEAEKLALSRGWIRLSDLPPSERRKYRAATAVRS